MLLVGDHVISVTNNIRISSSFVDSFWVNRVKGDDALMVTKIGLEQGQHNKCLRDIDRVIQFIAAVAYVVAMIAVAVIK